jgi:hypothetical protein
MCTLFRSTENTYQDILGYKKISQELGVVVHACNSTGRGRRMVDSRLARARFARLSQNK